MKKKIVFTVLLAVFFSYCLTIEAQTSPVLGDVNNDGEITIVDALITAQYYVGLEPAVFYASAADVNGSGIIDIVDALLIAQYYVGIITEFPAAGGFAVAMSDIQRNPSPAPGSGELDAVAAGINDFAFDCYARIKAGTGNIFFSPVSISFALTMCYAGANGNTETQMRNVMHYTLPDANLHTAYNALDLALTAPPTNPNPGRGEDVKFYMANSSWGQKNYDFAAAYLDTLAYNYGAGMYLVDFITDPEYCRSLINNWVSGKTENRIIDLLPPGTVSDGTRLVLTNAVYFKANWLYPFSTANTTNGTFYHLDGSTATVPLMLRSPILSYKEVTGEYQAVLLPYQGTKAFYMLVVLPAEGKFQSFENSLDLTAYTAVRQGMSNYQVTISMPKFNFVWETRLKTVLEALGMTDAFSVMNADFSGISNNPVEKLYIYEVLHKSFVAVDEKGTEASAATAVIATAVSTRPPSVTMTLNRPFLFFIYGPTGSIIFFGRVMEP